MNRKRLLVASLVAALAVAATSALFFPSDSPPATLRGASPRESDRPAASTRFTSLPSREAMGDPRGELFGPGSLTPAAPTPIAKPVAAAPQKPAVPQFPYRVAGQVAQEDGMRVVLSRGDRIFEVREGETLEDGYRLESITPHALKFTYVPLALTRDVPIAGLGLDMESARMVAKAPDASSPAQEQPAVQATRGTAHIRFDGPQEVSAGKPFEVALKVTSAQPVRAMPMQLRFDAKRLEPVAVRAGDLFSGGRFAYRVNPAGSIFIGASGSGRAAADAALFVVTFRPIGSGPAELKVSSLLVQDSTGHAIAHESPQTFRAAIR